MNYDDTTLGKPHLVWLLTDLLFDKLDAATWLDTTHELRQLGWQVTLVAAGPCGSQQIRGIDVFCVPKSDIYLLRQAVFHLRFVALFVRDWFTADVVLFHQMSCPWLLPLRLIRLVTGRQRPLFVMDVRTLHMDTTQNETFKARLRRLFYSLANWMANRWTDGQTAITLHMAKVVQIPARRLWGIWPSGVDVSRFALARETRRWPQTDEPIVLFYMGTLHVDRNLLTLCQAVEQANAEGMHFELVLIGEGTQRKDLERFAAETGEWIRVLPPVPHEQIPFWLTQAHVGVLPFPDEEKFRVSSPIKLFEYMASGLPVLCTQIVCHTDVIGRDEYVFWAKDASLDGLLAGLHNIRCASQRLCEMGVKAAAAAQNWTWQESAKKLKLALETGLQSVREPRNEEPILRQVGGESG